MARPYSHINNLIARIHTLETALATAQAAARRNLDAARTAQHASSINLELDEAGFLLIHLPGAHTLRWSLGTTQHDYAIAMKALVNVLRERRAEGQHPIATPGAPTLAELRTLTLRSDVEARRIEPKKRAEPLRDWADVTLADLGL